jgi:uncharacterized LabA/DUF88 family protein
MTEVKKFAIFIDGDNISPTYLGSLLKEVSNEGEILVKRIYGDWTTNSMNGWKIQILEFPVSTIQQFRLGENATDNAIVMDAIELIHTNSSVNSICIVSSDSDYYSLALRLREKGYYVLGVGNKNSKKIWVNSCKKFTYLENLQHETQTTHEKQQPDIENIIKYGLNNAKSNENGLILLSNFGKCISDRYPDFDYRDYNHRSLLELINEFKHILEISNDRLNPPNYSVKAKEEEKSRITETGKIKRLMLDFGIIKNDQGDYFYSNTNVLKDHRDQLKVGSHVKFQVIKQPDPEKTENSEKNGKAISVELIEESQDIIPPQF